ncbi:MAG: NYN domain-containing protein [Thermomicrobiales bacterium]
MTAIAYIDGFALYFGCFKGERNLGNAALKWLNLKALAEAILPDEDFALVRYYTARVRDLPMDPQRASRQDVYLRALRGLSGIEIHEGIFHRNKREAQLARCPDGIDPQQTVWIMQEKGSDASLVTHLLMDTFDGRFDVALIMTNDSDFVEPIRIVTERFGRRVVVISPDTVVARKLARVASHARPLDQRLIASCQLPDEIVGGDGYTVRRPLAWTAIPPPDS